MLYPRPVDGGVGGYEQGDAVVVAVAAGNPQRRAVISVDLKRISDDCREGPVNGGIAFQQEPHAAAAAHASGEAQAKGGVLVVLDV